MSGHTGALPVVRLERQHRVEEFDCGVGALNVWLKRHAWANDRADAARVYVAVDGERVAGYYALTAGSIQRAEASERVAKGLANHPVGVVLLARLAVDLGYRGSGLGKALLWSALRRAERAGDEVAARAVLVHAINEEAKRFYTHFGFEESPVDGNTMLLLMKDLRAAMG